MTISKAFDLVTEAYVKASGQTATQAKKDVAHKLAEVWALEAFGPGVASLVAAQAAPKVADGQTAIEIPDGPKKAAKKGGTK